MRYEWDSRKAGANLRKHGVGFDEAASVFRDPLAISGVDPGHFDAENRFLTFGISSLNRLLVVSHTYRSGTIRLISARRATRHERAIYEEG